MGISQHVELRHLRCLVALAEELNFRRAAERLHMTQPPLSRAIAQLEDLLGGRLFERSRVHCALTPLGATVAADAARLLAQMDAAASRWRESPAEAAAALRVGLFFALNPRHFRLIEREVHARLPGLAMELAVDRTHHLLSQLQRRRLDAAVVMLPAQAEGLGVVPLVETDMVALLPVTSPLARQRRVRVAELSTAGPLLFMRERDNPSLYRYLDEALRARGMSRPRHRVPRDTFAGLADIAAGRACAVVCRTMVDPSRRDMAFRPLHPQDRIAVTLGLAHDPALAGERLAALREGVDRYLQAALGPRGPRA